MSLATDMNPKTGDAIDYSLTKKNKVMEVKKSKVIKFEPLEKRGEYQAYSVVFDDGTEGITFAKYVQGQEGEYYVEVKHGGNGKSYNRIMKPKQDKGYSGGAKVNHRVRAISMGMSYSKDLLRDATIGKLGLTKIHEVIIPTMLSKLDSSSSSDEKDFVLSAMSYAKDCVLDEVVRDAMLEPFNIKEVTAVSLLEMTTRLFEGTFKAMRGYL